MLIMRPGQQLYIPGVQVLETKPPAASSNWWVVSGQTCVAAYQPKGAASLAASYVNLANPGTNNAAPGVAPTFNTADGWTFSSGLGQYLTTGIVPGTTGWSAIGRFSNGSGAGSGNMILGVFKSSTAAFGIMYELSSSVRYYNGGNATVAGAITSGVLAVAGSNGYRNGTLDTSSIGAWTGAITTDILIAARRREDTSVIDAYGNLKIQALAIYSTTLSAGNVASLTTAMNAL